MNKTILRQGIVLACVIGAALLPVVWAAWYVMDKHAWVQNNLAQLEPRHARLLGLERQKAELAEATQRAAAVRQQYVYPATEDSTQTGNIAQQKVRGIFAAAGLQITSSQVLPSKDDKGFDRIPIAVRAEGELLGVQSALAVLSSQQPAILINELSIQAQGALEGSRPDVAPRLVVQFNLSVFRERS